MLKKVKVRLGDFFPRPEHGWPEDKARRCLVLGSRVVEIQGGLGVAQVAVKHKDAEGVREGLWRIKSGAEEISRGLPESKSLTNVVRSRVKALEILVEPYVYKKALPKKTADVISEQLRRLGDYDLAIEGMSIRACGGFPMGAHALEKGRVEKLPEIPKGLLEEARKLKAKQSKELEARVSREHKALLRRIERRIEKKAKLK